MQPRSEVSPSIWRGMKGQVIMRTLWLSMGRESLRCVSMPDPDTFWGDRDYVWAALPRTLAHLIGFNVSSQPSLNRGSTTTLLFLILKAVLCSQNRLADSPNFRALVDLSLCLLIAQDDICLLK